MWQQWMMNSPDNADKIKSHLQSLKMLRSLFELISLCWYFSPDDKRKTTKQHYFIWLSRSLQFTILYRHLTDCVVFANIFFEKCLFLYIQYPKHDNIIHYFLTICQRITWSAVCPSPHHCIISDDPRHVASQPGLTLSWGVTQHDAGRGHKCVTS